MSVEFLMSQTILNQQVIPEVVKYPKLGLDIETRGLNPRQDDMILLQIGWGDNIWVIDTRRIDINPLLDILEDVNPLLIGHNIKFDLKFLKEQYGFNPKRVYCTQTAHVILYNGLLKSAYPSLRELVEKHADVRLNKDVRSSFKYTYGEVTEQQIQYAANDVRYLKHIFDAQLEKLKQDDLVRTAQLEFSLIPAIADMELNGIKLNTEKWKDLTEVSRSKVSGAEMQIAKILQDVEVQSSFMNTPKLSVNPDSPKQMLDRFHKRGIDIDDTQASTLKKVDDPLAKALLKYREASKLLSTYGHKFLEHVESDGRIHSEFNAVGSQTGRFSSSDPNLQNVPEEKEYRSCFTVDDGNLMLTADYSQVELRAAAVLSQEPVMLEEYQKIDADLHTLTASNVYDVPPEEVTHNMRNSAKSVNFGILYGISKYGLKRKFRIPYTEGEKLIKGHAKAYPKLTKYMKKKSLGGLKQGFVTTAIGRKRYFSVPPMDDKDYYRKVSSIKRMSGNTPIQGTAADIMKQSLINVYNAIQPYDGKLLMTVHDELSVEFPKENLSEVRAIVQNEMMRAGEQILGNDLEWLVDIEYGETWSKP